MKESTTEGNKVVPAETHKKFRSLIKNGSLRPILELNWQKGSFAPNYIILVHTKELNSDLQCTKGNYEKLLIGGTLKSSAAEALERILSNVVEDGSQEYIEKKLEILDATKIEFGTSCDSCSRPLANKDAQYLSYQDRKYFCKACGEKEDDTKHGVERYANPHALIYLNFKDPRLLRKQYKAELQINLNPKQKKRKLLQKFTRVYNAMAVETISRIERGSNA